ncbi:MAG TPA: protein translocase subunit SecD [Deltaproteobacteria bacterium]|nr:protein translocase subunit SecD [Deltaproteobacteria bacterium]
MSSRWRYKTLLAVFLTLFAVYLLIPSVFNFRALREAAEKTGGSPPWYVKLFPDKQLSLGLDIQGGIYLELEVDLNDALVHRSDIISGELERFLKEKGIPYRKVSVIPKTSLIGIYLKDPASLPMLRRHLDETYGTALKELPQAPLLSFEVPSGGEGAMALPYEELLGWTQGKEGAPPEASEILEVTRFEGKIQVVLRSPEDSAKVAAAIRSRFGESLQPADVGPALYLAQSESYQERLREETLKQAVETIRNRIDRYGVAEPDIRRLGSNRVVVELPGVSDPDRAVGLVKRAGKLEFKLVDDGMTDAQVQQMVEQARSEFKIPSGYTEEVVGKLNEALKAKLPPESEIAYEIQYDPVTKKIVGGIPYLLKSKVEVSGEMLRNAQVSVHNNEPYVSLSFDNAGTKAFADLTAANIKKRLAILLDGTVSKAPVINSAIPSGEAQITLGYGDYQALMREAEDLVLVLREGALPASLQEATKTVIGPSLGKASIDRGWKAMLIAAAVVMVFMVFYYKGSGLLADLAVVLNVLFIFAALTLFGATLTLPGVAGIVLTIGMAVDANVIILERVKEELAAGKSIKAAVDAGYSNAMRAIVDSNLTTFLSGVVLYQFGTGPVRGFAVTLMVGILTTLYTAVVLTRLVYDYILSRRQVTKLSI